MDGGLNTPFSQIPLSVFLYIFVRVRSKSISDRTLLPLPPNRSYSEVGKWTLLRRFGFWSHLEETINDVSRHVYYAFIQVYYPSSCTERTLNLNFSTEPNYWIFIYISSGNLCINPRPTRGLFRAHTLVFLRYLLNQCRYHHQTCSTLSPNNFTHCAKMLRSRVS